MNELPTIAPKPKGNPNWVKGRSGNPYNRTGMAGLRGHLLTLARLNFDKRIEEALANLAQIFFDDVSGEILDRAHRGDMHAVEILIQRSLEPRLRREADQVRLHAARREALAAGIAARKTPGPQATPQKKPRPPMPIEHRRPRLGSDD